MPRGRPRKSTKELNREGKETLSEATQAVAEAVSDDELRLLSKLKEKYENEATGERVPGKTVKGVKTMWTYQDLCNRFSMVSFIPDETIPLTYNGVKVWAFAGIEMKVPKPFQNIYEQHKAELRPRKPMDGITIDLGAGALPPDL